VSAVPGIVEIYDRIRLRFTRSEFSFTSRMSVFLEEIKHWIFQVGAEVNGRRFLKISLDNLDRYIERMLSGDPESILWRLHELAGANELNAYAFNELGADLSRAAYMDEVDLEIGEWLHYLLDEGFARRIATVPYVYAVRIGIRLVADE